ncbi:hypothetical protein HK104_003008 [Borealophlyctis nickersoniae]|nr:hypothetical protein HK104_003008 [Borealophlyctis nickersoniae]
MQTDYQEQTDNNMNATIAADAFQRYVVAQKIKPKGAKTKNSGLNSLKNHKVLDHFSMPNRALEIILSVNTKKRDNDGNPVKYAQSWYSNLTKTLSRIAQNLTEEERIRIMDDHYSKQNDPTSRFKLMRFNDQQKLDEYRVNIENLYKAFNGGNYMESRQSNISQKMNERQTAASQPYDQLLDKVTRAIGECDLNTAQGVFRYQFLVAALIKLLAYRNRRRDYVDVRLNDGEEVNVVLREDGIFIKKTNKTDEPQVLLEFKDERLINAVNKLVDIRRKQGKDHLFLKKDGDVAADVNKWFGERFPKVMEQLGIGKNLTMGVFRRAFGIKLSEEHDGTLASEKNIEDCMGHKWETHQLYYNLTPLENGEVREEEPEDEGEE